MRNRVFFIVTLFICVCAANAMWINRSLDKQGVPQLGGDPVMGLLLVLPYVIIGAVLVWNRNKSLVMAGCLLAVLGIEAVNFHTLFSDQVARQHEAPGREVQHYGLLAVLLVEWIGSLVVLLSAVVYRIILAAKKRPA